MTLPTTARKYTNSKLDSFNDLILQQAPVAPPKDDQVLVKIHAVSLQYRDLMIAKRQYFGHIEPDLIPCSDMAGEIIAVGSDVKQWRVGDRVCANFMLDKLHNHEHTQEMIDSALGAPVHGVLIEYRTFPAHSLVAIPSHLSYEEASTLPCAALTAYNALLDGHQQLRGGDTVLILGTGGVSIFALQFAVASGATCIVLSSSDEKLKVATKLGAKHIINYKTTPNWHEDVLKLTNGRGVDRVIEVSGYSTFKQSLDSVKLGGSIDVIGAVGSSAPAVDFILSVIRKSITIRGIFIGSVSQFEAMNRLITAHPETTRPVVDKVFPFEEAKAAFAYLESQAHVGKVVIKVAAN